MIDRPDVIYVSDEFLDVFKMAGMASQYGLQFADEDWYFLCLPESMPEPEVAP